MTVNLACGSMVLLLLKSLALAYIMQLGLESSLRRRLPSSPSPYQGWLVASVIRITLFSNSKLALNVVLRLGHDYLSLSQFGLMASIMYWA